MPYDVHRGIAGIWAGVSLGGALVAAPAKFTVPALSLEVGLQVGRAQFYWVGMIEITLCAILIASIVFLKIPKWYWSLLPISILVVQQIFVMPFLSDRTTQIVAGEIVSSSSIHIFYIALEIVKCGSLAMLGLGVLKIGEHPIDNI